MAAYLLKTFVHFSALSALSLSALSFSLLSLFLSALSLCHTSLCPLSVFIYLSSFYLPLHISLFS